MMKRLTNVGRLLFVTAIIWLVVFVVSYGIDISKSFQYMVQRQKGSELTWNFFRVVIMPFNPFGGYKNSGFGREHGKYGFSEVTQIKIVAKNK